MHLVRAWGTSTGPTACALAGRLCALWGWQRGVPGGGAFRRCEGRLRSGASPPPTARPLGGLSRSVTHVLWARARGCGGPALSPWLACPVGAACRGTGGGPSPGGVACHRCEGCLRSGASPLPTACPLGGQSGSVTHVPCARACGCGGPALSPRLACPVEAACRGVGGGPSLGGVACHRCEGRLVSGAVPPLTTRPPGQAAGVPRLVCPGCGWCGRGDPATGPQRAHLRAGVARCGRGGRASPGGVAFRRCEGRLRSGAPCPPTARPPRGLSGSVTDVLFARVRGCGGPALFPWRACPVGAARRRSGGRLSPGGLACHRCEGRLVSGAVPPPGRPSCKVGSWGSATRVSRVLLVWAWGLSTGPTACALAGRRCALWGWRKGVPRGGSFRRCEGRLRSGAPPP